MTCPICNKEAATQYRPFCSRRCADIDLGRWLTGGYAIPVEGSEDENGTGTSETVDPLPTFRPQ